MKRSISKEQMNELPLYEYKGEVHVIDQQKDVKACIKKLSKHSILGFDTETRPSFKKGDNHPVALLQLATLDEAFLFRLNFIKLDEDLIKLLENENIQKVGMAIRDDLKALQKLTPFKPAGFIELDTLAKKARIEVTGLRPLCGLLIGKRLSKKAKLSNWENKILKTDQVIYAAADASIGLAIYHKLQNLLEPQ